MKLRGSGGMAVGAVAAVSFLGPVSSCGRKQVHTDDPPGDILEMSREFHKPKELFEQGKLLEAAGALGELAVSPEYNLVARADATERLCDLLRYARWDEPTVAQSLPVIESVEGELDRDLAGNKPVHPEGRARLTRVLEYIRATRALMSGRPAERPSCSDLHKEVASLRSTSEETVDELLRRSAEVADVQEGVLLAAGILGRLERYKGLAPDLLQALALGKLGEALEIEDPIRSVRYSVWLEGWSRRQRREAILASAGPEAGEEILRLTARARNRAKHSYWGGFSEE